jgi:hypothetical protein
MALKSWGLFKKEEEIISNKLSEELILRLFN